MISIYLDRGDQDDGRLDVALSHLNGKRYVWTSLTPDIRGFGLTAAQARFYAEALNALADELDRPKPEAQTILTYGLNHKEHAAALQAALNAPPVPEPRFTVLVTAHPREFDHWCYQNHRNPRDRTIIRISDGHRDAHKLQGLADFDLVVLSEIPHHNEAMQQLSYRLSTRPREDSSQ